MIKKSLAILMVLLTIVGCKKNEEDFVINEDLLSPIISHAHPDFPDYFSSWIGNYMITRTSNQIVATGEKTNTTESRKSITDKEIYFAEKNLMHTFTPSGKKIIRDWVSINNDEIKVDADDFFYEVSPTYFDVEISSTEYDSFKSIKEQLGEELVGDIDPTVELLTGIFPKGKIERLILTMDYSFLSTDKTQESREFREYHFYRINPTEGGFVFTTLEAYTDKHL